MYVDIYVVTWLMSDILNSYLTTILSGFAADYQRSLSVPISIFVEDTDSYSGSIDLSCSLDLRMHQLPLRVIETSESINSVLLWVTLLLNRKIKNVPSLRQQLSDRILDQGQTT